MNSQPSSVSTRSIVRVGGGAPATTIRVRPRPGISPSHSCRGVEDRGDDRRCAAQQRDAVLAHAPQDLGAVDLAQHDVAAAHAGDRVRHAPAVAVEHRQRVQVARRGRSTRRVPAEHGRVQPDVAVRELHTLRSRGRAARVVDRRGVVLVGVGPRLGLGTVAVQLRVGLRADHEPVLGVDAAQRVVELGIDEQHRRARVLDDVRDLLRVEPEVDRHEHAAAPAHAEERREQARRVVRHDRDALTAPDAERVEPGGLRAGAAARSRATSACPTTRRAGRARRRQPTRSP